jgi:tRNA-(ms[2]io[6]A)-hydroxylase
MLGLKVSTRPGWIRAAAADPVSVLVDHAHCEKKAAASALSLISKYPARRDLVERLVALAQEELEHFARVVKLVHERGADLGPDRADLYVNRLRDLVRKPEPEHLLDRLLVSALIEARSCERFQILAESAPEPELRALYGELLASEAGHYSLFVDLARRFCGKAETEARLEELLLREAEIVTALDDRPLMHG